MVRRIEEADDIISLVLEPSDGEPLPNIEPGQYVSVFADLPDGRRQPRQYTVSSTASGTRLQITVNRVRGVDGAPDGQVSSFLNDTVKVGDLLDVSAPAGDFVVQSSDEPLLLASAGAGITTVLPIVEHIARTQPQRKVIVAHADRAAQDHALRDTVLHAGRQIDDFTAYTWYERRRPLGPALGAGLDGPDRSSRCPRTCRCSPAGHCPSCGTYGPSLLARGVPAATSATRCSAPTCGPRIPRVRQPEDADGSVAVHAAAITFANCVSEVHPPASRDSQSGCVPAHLAAPRPPQRRTVAGS